MPKTPGPQPSPKPSTPTRGMNGPTDKGTGTSHRANPAVPPPDRGGRITGTIHSKGKYEKGK